MNFTVLIIDDHQMIVDWYKQILHKQFKEAKVLSATSVQEGVKQIDTCTRLDLLLVDYNLGKGNDKDAIVNGVEFVRFSKSKFPDLNVVLITGHEGVLVLYDIHKKIVPQALLLKIDVTESLLQKAIQKVLGGERFYSFHASEGLKEIYKKEALLQEQNIQILLLLDKGFKIKEISETLFLSESAVNKRIAGLKQTFDVLDNGGLIKKIKEEGFI
ncbi:response regulator transcription factor [Myroides odoratus]|uniref:response regulator transcription factor n=1 Tax=Myroides odoratus TaxID=256 RepID=UPI0039B0156E